MLKYHNRNPRTTWEISSTLTIDIRMTSLTSFCCLYFMLSFYISHVIIKSLLLILIRKMFARSPCYESASTLEQKTSSFYCPFEHISYLVLVLLSLILSMHLIASFYILYFSRFYIKMNSVYIFYSFLEIIYTKWNAHPIASSSKQDVFIINFNARFSVNFLSFLYFDK